MCSGSFFSLSSCKVPGLTGHRGPLCQPFVLCHRECHTNMILPAGHAHPVPILAARLMPVDVASREPLPTLLFPQAGSSPHPHPRWQIPEDKAVKPRTLLVISIPDVVSTWVLQHSLGQHAHLPPSAHGPPLNTAPDQCLQENNPLSREPHWAQIMQRANEKP